MSDDELINASDDTIRQLTQGFADKWYSDAPWKSEYVETATKQAIERRDLLVKIRALQAAREHARAQGA